MAIRKQYTEVFVGLFLFFGLAVMGILVLQFGRIQDKLTDHYTLKLDLPDASGIRKGVPVRLGGTDIGSVATTPVLKSDFSGLRLELKIFAERKVPRGSQFAVGTSGLMGDTFIRINLPEKHDGEYYKPGELITGRTGSDLNDIQNNAESLLKEVSKSIGEVRKTVEKLDTLFQRVETGVLDDENLSNIKLILTELRESSININQATQKLDPIVSNTDKIIREAQGATGKVNGVLTSTEDAMKEVIVTMQSIQTTITATDPVLVELREVLQQANRTINKIENGDGLAAVLVNDSELRRDVESLIDKLDRNGVLFYPREKQNKATKPPVADTPQKKRKPFQWLKPKKDR